jgi:hypothetical protein
LMICSAPVATANISSSTSVRSASWALSIASKVPS